MTVLFRSIRRYCVKLHGISMSIFLGVAAATVLHGPNHDFFTDVITGLGPCMFLATKSELLVLTLTLRLEFLLTSLNSAPTVSTASTNEAFLGIVKFVCLEG